MPEPRFIRALMSAGREFGVGAGSMDTQAGVEMNLRGHYLGGSEKQTGQWTSVPTAIDCRAAR